MMEEIIITKKIEIKKVNKLWDIEIELDDDVKLCMFEKDAHELYKSIERALWARRYWSETLQDDRERLEVEVEELTDEVESLREIVEEHSNSRLGVLS